jgi:hypothetical protein
MRTVRAILRDGSIRPFEPIDWPENTPITAAPLESEDLFSAAPAELAGTSNALQFLNDPRENVYTESDGEAV